MTDLLPTSSKTAGTAHGSRRTVRSSLAALLIAGTALGGFAVGSLDVHRAYADSPIQPTGSAQKIPDFTQLVKQVKPAVVSITAQIKEGDEDDEGGGMGGGQQMPFPFPFPFGMMPQGHGHRSVEARGSGFIISSDGYIVTNNHVVKGATSVSVTLDDGTSLKAKIIGRDPKTDIALIKVSPKDKLPFVELGESEQVEPGQWVIAIGNPYGLGGSVTAGIVSARGRDIGDGPYDSFIQVDAPINRGNSGGPLLTQDGKVVGINTAILSPGGGGSIGIGFAIPSDTVKEVVAQLRKTGHVTRGYLGVTAQQITPALARALGLPVPPSGPPSGALVAGVQSDSPAEKAGIKTGDVLTALNGQKIDSPHDLAIKVAGIAPGTKATLDYLRNNAKQTASITIANLSKGGDNGTSGGNGGNASNGSIGVGLAPLTPDLRQQLGIDEGVKGVVVRDVRPGSPADQAGIRQGDLIVGVGNQLVSTPHEAVEAVHAALKHGGVALRIMRDGQTLFVPVSPNSDSGDNGDNGDDSDDNQ